MLIKTFLVYIFIVLVDLLFVTQFIYRMMLVKLQKLISLEKLNRLLLTIFILHTVIRMY
jgi:hypothetical protein